MVSGAAGGSTPQSRSPTWRSRPSIGVPLFRTATRIERQGSGRNMQRRAEVANERRDDVAAVAPAPARAPAAGAAAARRRRSPPGRWSGSPSAATGSRPSAPPCASNARFRKLVERAGERHRAVHRRAAPPAAIEALISWRRKKPRTLLLERLEGAARRGGLGGARPQPRPRPSAALRRPALRGARAAAAPRARAPAGPRAAWRREREPRGRGSRAARAAGPRRAPRSAGAMAAEYSDARRVTSGPLLGRSRSGPASALAPLRRQPRSDGRGSIRVARRAATRPPPRR